MSGLLNALAEAFDTRRPNARTTAALLSNPGCNRRGVLDAANVDLAKLAARLGSPTQFGQSPFAIGQGNRFERRIKENDHEELAKAINELLGIFGGLDHLVTVNLERVGTLNGRRLIRARADATAEVLRAIALGDPSAPHVMDHAVTTLDVGGTKVFLEQDALAFREGGALRVCEIKGFPIIDGTASPTKVGAAARQTAVYVASIQDTLAGQGLDPEMVSPVAVLVCPRNFTIAPVAVEVDVRRELRALRRHLRRRASAPEIAQAVQTEARRAGVDLRAAVAFASQTDDPDPARAVVDAIDFVYGPTCLSSCDLSRYCRSSCKAADDPAHLGGEVAALAGSVGSIGAALALADDDNPPGDLVELAAGLAAARRAAAEALAFP